MDDETGPRDPLRQHQRALLLRQRCGVCAERVRPLAVLREEDCPSCGAALSWGNEGSGVRTPGGVVTAMKDHWMKERWVAYGLVGVLTLIGGHIPFVAPMLLVLVVAMVHFRLLRRPLRWLSHGRRITLKLTLKLFVAFLAVVNVVVNLVLAPFLTGGAIIVAVVSVCSLMAYVELAHFMLARRLGWDRERRPLAVAEWAPPFGMMGALMASIAVPGAALGAGVYWLSTVNVPTVAEIASWVGG